MVPSKCNVHEYYLFIIIDTKVVTWANYSTYDTKKPANTALSSVQFSFVMKPLNAI